MRLLPHSSGHRVRRRENQAVSSVCSFTLLVTPHTHTCTHARTHVRADVWCISFRQVLYGSNAIVVHVTPIIKLLFTQVTPTLPCQRTVDLQSNSVSLFCLVVTKGEIVRVVVGRADAIVSK